MRKSTNTEYTARFLDLYLFASVESVNKWSAVCAFFVNPNWFSGSGQFNDLNSIKRLSNIVEYNLPTQLPTAIAL